MSATGNKRLYHVSAILYAVFAFDLRCRFTPLLLQVRVKCNASSRLQAAARRSRERKNIPARTVMHNFI